MVRVSVDVPVGVVRLLRDLGRFGGVDLPVKEWAKRELVEAARATVDAVSEGEFIQGSVLRKRYGLEKKEEDC